MNTKKVVGLVLLVLGVVLLILGFQSSQGLDDQISEAVTGEFTDNTLIYWIGGVICAVAGVAMLALKR